MRNERAKAANRRLVIDIVESHPLAMCELRRTLKSFPGARFHSTLPAQLRNEGTPVVIVDVGALPGPPGELLRSVRQSSPSAKTIVLNAEGSGDYLLELLFLGVSGFVAYDRVANDLPAAIRAAARDAIWMPAQTLGEFSDKRRQVDSGLHEKLLTSREQAVLGLLQRGLCNKEIASSLGISLSTVKFHLGNAFRKLNVHDRLAAATRGDRRHLLKPVPHAAG